MKKQRESIESLQNGIEQGGDILCVLQMHSLLLPRGEDQNRSTAANDDSHLSLSSSSSPSPWLFSSEQEDQFHEPPKAVGMGIECEKERPLEFQRPFKKTDADLREDFDSKVALVAERGMVQFGVGDREIDQKIGNNSSPSSSSPSCPSRKYQSYSSDNGQ